MILALVTEKIQVHTVDRLAYSKAARLSIPHEAAVRNSRNKNSKDLEMSFAVSQVHGYQELHWKSPLFLIATNVGVVKKSSN